MTESERHQELAHRMDALLTEFGDLFGSDLDLPVLGPWVVVAAFDDALIRAALAPPGQWPYVSIGLATWAAGEWQRGASEVD